MGIIPGNINYSHKDCNVEVFAFLNRMQKPSIDNIFHYFQIVNDKRQNWTYVEKECEWKQFFKSISIKSSLKSLQQKSWQLDQKQTRLPSLIQGQVVDKQFCNGPP
jgi:hypothetical protein